MSTGSTAVRLGILGAATAAVFVLIAVREADRFTPATGHAYVRTFDVARNGLDRILAESDGQAFAALAEDPALAHPERFVGGNESAAYRFQRPLLGYLAWLLAGGRASTVRVAVAVAVVLSAGAAVFVAARLQARRGAPMVTALAVLLVPGSFAVLNGLMAELLALALAFGGVVSILGGRREWPALTMFTAAALARETALLVPIALAAWLLRTGERSTRVITIVAVPAGVVAIWWAVLRARLGAWPWEGAPGAFDLPFVGLWRGAADWRPSADLAIAVVAVAIPAVVAFARRREALAWIALAHVPLAVVLHELTWSRWWNFSRPLLPLGAAGVLLLARGKTIAAPTH